MVLAGLIASLIAIAGPVFDALRKPEISAISLDADSAFDAPFSVSNSSFIFDMGDAKVICDPAVLVEGGEIHVWFGGGDAASPDENLHGQIGFAALRPVNATLAK